MSVLIDTTLKKLLRSLTTDERQALRENLLRDGCIEPFPYCVIDGVSIQLDGHHRREICEAERIPFSWRQITTVTTKAQAIAWVISRQAGRRNLAADDLEALRAERRDRVVEAREQGRSIRAIAEAEKVSPITVQRDLEAAGATPDAPAKEVTGRDGKKYQKPAKKAKKPKKEGFDFKVWKSHFGYVLRGIDDLYAETEFQAAERGQAVRRRLAEARACLDKVYTIATDLGNRRS